jgi:hypothetical protein
VACARATTKFALVAFVIVWLVLVVFPVVMTSIGL